MNRTCSRTRLALVDGPADPVYRLATSSYGALNPPEREAGVHVESWSRWDAPKRTIYAVDSRRAAFVEATSWARQLKPQKAPVQLAKTAAALGMTPAELAAEIDEEWGTTHGMVRGWLPAGWRETRQIYQLTFAPGSWVDVTHSDTLMAISDGMRDELYDLGYPLGLTNAELASNNRELTTTIATWLREKVVLDDDRPPVGVAFQSKHGRHDDGQGTCWAYWMRELDSGKPTTAVTADDGTEFEADDPDFAYALKLHGIQAR